MQPKISFDALFTVFLRTIIATFAGAVFASLISIFWQYLGLPEGDDIGLIILPLFTIGAGIGFIMYAKRKWGNFWSIAGSGILGFFVIIILLVLAFGTSL